MRVALVHDYLIDYGGAEEVLVAFHDMYPEAPIYVSILDTKGMGHFMDKYKNAKIVTSWFQHIPFSSKLISPFRFLLPWIWSSFDFSAYDVILSSASWAVTKGFKKGPHTKEICYLHTPPRYLYGYDTSRKWNDKWYRRIVDLYALIVNHFMRLYDFTQAQKVDIFIANSENIGERIKKFYRREYAVVYPPVDVNKFTESKVTPMTGEYFLTGGRLVGAKNFDLIIKACEESHVALKIFGDGIDRERLQGIAGKDTELLGRITDDEKIAYMKGAKAFILAQADEDFGITPIEAASCGTPSVAYFGGGYKESIAEGKTGIFFHELSIDSLASVIKEFDKKKWDRKAIQKHAEKFSREKFESEIRKVVEGK